MSLWQDVEEALIREIDDGILTPGVKLPADQDLAVRFGVHRHTVRRALSGLQSQGLVRCDRGRGTFVVDDVVAVRLGTQTQFEENLLRSNRTPRRTIISLAEMPAAKDVTRALKIKPGSRVLLAVFLGEADGIPIHTVRMSFSLNRLAGLADILRAFGSDENVDLPSVLRKVGVKSFRRKSVRIRCRLPTKNEAHHLRISPMNPVFETVIVNVDDEDEPVFVATTAFCGGRVELVLDL